MRVYPLFPIRLQIAADFRDDARPDPNVGCRDSSTAHDLTAVNQERAGHREPPPCPPPPEAEGTSTRTSTSVGFPPAVSVMSWGQAEIAMMAGSSARSRMWSPALVAGARIANAPPGFT